MAAPRNQDEHRWHHLFTSTIRDLYIADAINVIAAPHGAFYRFRYEVTYVQEDMRSDWQNDQLRGRPIIAHFSIQHPAQFHEAMYIPLRTGTVVSTSVVGNTYLIVFSLDSYAPLPDSIESHEGAAIAQRAQRVRDFTEQLRNALGENHPDDGIHAAEGVLPDVIASPPADPGRAFETIVRYLTPSLHFDRHVYFRLDRIDGSEMPSFENGWLPLIAGRTYVLQLAHYQAEALEQPAKLTVSVPPMLTLLGASEIVLNSRYDVIPITVFSPFRDDPAEGVIRVTTCDPLKGPALQLPVKVSPPSSDRFTWPAVAVGGAIALAVPPVLPDRYLSLKLGLVLVGAFVATVALYVRRARGLPT